MYKIHPEFIQNEQTTNTKTSLMMLSHFKPNTDQKLPKAQAANTFFYFFCFHCISYSFLLLLWFYSGRLKSILKYKLIFNLVFWCVLISDPTNWIFLLMKSNLLSCIPYKYGPGTWVNTLSNRFRVKQFKSIWLSLSCVYA